MRHADGGEMGELTVNVGRAPIIVARHQCVKGSDTVRVDRLHAAERGAHQDRRVVGVAHAGVALDTDVDTLFPIASARCFTYTNWGTYRGVGAPDVNIRVLDRLAGVDIHGLDGERHGDTRLAVGDVLADLLTENVYHVLD